MLKQRIITALLMLAVLLPALFHSDPRPFCLLTLLPHVRHARIGLASCVDDHVRPVQVDTSVGFHDCVFPVPGIQVHHR